MRIYELALVLKTSLSDTQRKKVLDTIKSFLKGLKITKEEEKGEKKLAYKIKKQDSGFYMNFAFEGENIPSDIEKKLLNNEDVLRHLLSRKK